VPAATSPHGFIAEGLAALSPTNVWAAGASGTGEPLDTVVPAAEHWDGTSWSLVPVPNPDQGTRFRTFLSGIAARVTQVQLPLGQRTTFTYKTSQTVITDARNKRTTLNFDTNNNLVSAIDGAGNRTRRLPTLQDLFPRVCGE
jgi:hypothetical protein